MMKNYSTSQMDNFYETLASGIAKPSGVMNYIQHLFVAERCYPGASVLDVCCGRALMIPLLKQYASHITKYVGVDISSSNLSDAQKAIHQMDDGTSEFSSYLLQGDVTDLSFLRPMQFDVVVYLSALEHLEKEAGSLSLHQVSRMLSQKGTLYLSTPNTPSKSPRKLQYKVHVYEWSFDEIRMILNDLGLAVVQCIGLLPPPEEVLFELIVKKYGSDGGKWFRDMRSSLPNSFLAPIVASSFPESAREIMLICRKRLEAK